MPRQILVPLDGSPFSEHALPAALDLARQTGARLHLVHVHEVAAAQVYPDGLPVFDERWDGALRAQEEEYLRSLAHRCMETAGISPVSELLEGAVSTAIATYAAEMGVDRIIMTTHGRGGISRAWVGSVADALVRKAAVPILLIRPKEHGVDWSRGLETRHVLIPLDGSAMGEGILDAALEIGMAQGARFTLLRVVLPVPFAPTRALGGPTFSAEGMERARQNADEYLQRVAGQLRERGATVSAETLVHTAPALGILDYAATAAVDLIAMATHGRGGWSRVALGSVADKVMRGTMMPVLLYRPTISSQDGASQAESNMTETTAPEADTCSAR
jgi:nucleotide-binding universal stress UspA family protein